MESFEADSERPTSPTGISSSQRMPAAKPILSKKERDDLYYNEQCISPKELKKAIEEEAMLGAGGKITNFKWYGKGASTKLIVTVAYPDKTQKAWPIKAHSVEGKTFINHRSLKFFANKQKGAFTEDLNDLIDKTDLINL
jgi:hypothetical protein